MLPSHALPCRALPCRALPCRALPCRALDLIREYSRPMTRPDWRDSKPIITPHQLVQLARSLQLYHNTTMKNKLVYYIILRNNKTNY